MYTGGLEVQAAGHRCQVVGCDLKHNATGAVQSGLANRDWPSAGG